MKRNLLSFAACFCLIFFVFSFSMATEKPLHKNPGDAIAQLLKQEIPDGGPGIAVLVAKDDRVLFRGARGLANIEWMVPASPDHIFPIGSDTKTFVAATVLKLVECGKISLEDDLSKFLPNYPEASRIKIRQLLNHTSGVGDYTQTSGFFRTTAPLDTDTANLIAQIEKLPMDFAPGERWAYSNSNYILLQAVIELITARPWALVVEETILGPLGLSHTMYADKTATRPMRASGYQRDGEGSVRNAWHVSASQTGASGGLESNVDDLFVWLRALHTGKVLSPAHYRAMTSPRATSADRNIYGYGLWIETRKARRVYWHGGRLPGFSSQMAYFPDQGITVILLRNEDSGKPNLDNLVDRLFDITVRHGLEWQGS